MPLLFSTTNVPGLSVRLGVGVPPTPLVPVRVRLALAALPIALSVALTLPPLLVGAYSTVSVQDMLGPRLLPLHPSWVLVKADDPDWVSVSGPVALRPE